MVVIVVMPPASQVAVLRVHNATQLELAPSTSAYDGEDAAGGEDEGGCEGDGGGDSGEGGGL